MAPTAATAATPVAGITTTVNFGGTTHNGTPVLTEDTDGTLTIQYSNVESLKGQTVDVELPEGVSLGAFTGNNANVTVTQVGGKLRLVFANSFDSNQGVVTVKFRYSNVDKSEKVDFVYKVGGTPITEDLIVLNSGDQIENVSKWEDKARSGDFGSAVTVANDVVAINPNIIGKVLTYTLTFNSKTGNAAYAITDALPAGMVYGGTFTWSETTWDADGLNRSTATRPITPNITGTGASGQSFATTLDVKGPSNNTLTYTASIADEAARVALQAQLQAAYDLKKNTEGASYSVALTNNAVIGGTSKSNTVSVSGTIPTAPRPGTGTGTFEKKSDWSSKNIEDGAGGTVLPVDVTWSLKANLAAFNGTTNDHHILDRNVVISDALPAQATWNTGASDFITATGLTLTKVATCPATPAEFANSAVGSWCVTGQTLMVNVGQDKATNALIQAKAQITTTTGLGSANTTVQGGKAWSLTNNAVFSYSTAATTSEITKSEGESVTLVDRGNGEDGYNDTAVFTKNADNKVAIDPATKVATVRYKFELAAGKGLDARDLTIVDQVDGEIFDISDLSAIAVESAYNYQNLAREDVSLTKDGAGNLVIGLTASGKAKVATAGADKNWTTYLTLTTKPVTGKQTIAITNHADLMANGQDVKYWSEKKTEASSFGDEAEVNKFVRNSGTHSWTQNLRAEIDQDGDMVDSTYVYRVEFYAHNNYHGIPMIDVVDNLPAGVQFLGFVDEANADTGAGASTADKNLGNNVWATFNATDNTVTMSTRGQNLSQNTRVNAYFAVKVVSSTADVPIVNTVSGSSATITPTDGYPIGVAKVDDANPTKVINDPNARFELLDSDDTVVVSDIFVSNGMLRTDDNGVTKGVKVSRPGTYKLRELVPPTGYVKSDEVLTIVVEADSVPEQKTFYNKATGGYVKVGDYVWIDKNHDGLQDATDVVVPGVELKIERIDANGDAHPVTGVNRMPVLNQITNDQGKYLFDLLPKLDAGEVYKVTVVTKPTLLDGFVPTTPGTDNGAAGNDSSTGSAVTVKDLTTNGKEDLTLDFGFVKPYVTVGDYVWIDVNKDGLQDATDIVIPGVKLAIYGPDGTKVTHDVYGDPIADQVTNAQGKYLFDNLPVLGADESYTVKIVRDDADTVEALKGLKPTTEGTDGGSGSNDSSDWTSTSTKPLTTHQAQDLTLDFGFIRLAVSVGDYVWVDTDRDGLQGDPADEPGIPGVLLEVYGPDGTKVTHDVDGNLLPVVRTDADGLYSFDNLPALENPEDSYTVKIVRTDPQTVEALKPYVPTTPGTDNGTGADDSSTWESTTTGDLTEEGAHDPTLDFGFVPTYVSVGDYVWIDVNRDGLQDSSDIPVADVVLKVELVTVDAGETTLTAVTNVLGQPVGTTTTDADGHYEFTKLPVLKPGQSYRVSIVEKPALLDTYMPTTPGTANGNGADDSSTATSDSVIALDGTVVPATPKDAAHVGEDPTLDFGFVQKKVSVGNIVWIDSDEDGVRDPSEDPIPGVTITITRTDGEPVNDVYGNPVTDRVTDTDGTYEFDDLPALPPGTHYKVTIDYSKSPILEDLNLVPTNPGNRGDDTDPKNDYSHTDSATSRDLTEDGDEDPTLDFGFRKAKVSVGDYVWIDVNRDGLQDSTDVPLKGVVLKITGPDGNPVTDVFGNIVEPTRTDAKGFYEFTNLPVLPAGKGYTVSIVKDDPSTVEALKGLVVTKAGVGSDKGADSSTDQVTSWVDLSRDGAHDPTLDFGFQRAAVKVGDYVWLDNDRNGKQGAKEKGIENVWLELRGPDGKPVVDVNGKPVKPVATDKDGHYEFGELPVLEPGQSYTVSIMKKKSRKALKGLFPTVANKGSNKAVDSSTNTSVSWKPLTSNGAEDMTLDFGFYSGDVAGITDENDGDPNGGVNGNGEENGNGEVAGESDTNDGPLPDTGSPVGAWAVAGGLLLLLGGAGALLLNRRRREI